jgi:hypothetical protein
LKKQIPISELVKPLTLKLWVDGTVKMVNLICVANSLCAYDLNDRQYASSKYWYHVLLALINANQSYDILNHYFKIFQIISNYYMKKFKKKSLQNNWLSMELSVISILLFVQTSNLYSCLVALIVFVENTVVFTVDHIKAVIVKLKVFS